MFKRQILGVALMLPLFAAVFEARAVSPLLKEFEDAYVRLGEIVLPSVVEIAAQVERDPEEERRLNDLFRQFGPEGQGEEGEPEGERPEGGESPVPGPPVPQTPPPALRPPTATGSGFIYDTEGHIITNNHVVQRSTSLKVKLQDGTIRDAKIVGQDPDTDLAVIRIDPEGLNLKPVKMGDSTGLKVGQFAIALGSPRGLTGSVSFGHISALGREELQMPETSLRFQHFIQTDAAINLGNSGGPLCNLDGEVIGVNIAIAFGANSIGFAIPSSTASKVVPQLIAKGRVSRGWLGVQIVNVAEAAERAEQSIGDYIDAFGLPDKRGASVQAVTPDGPAEKAGLRADDVVYRINGEVVDDKIELINIISDIAPGSPVELDVWREGQEIKLRVAELGEFTNRETATWGKPVLGMHFSEITPEQAERIGSPELAGRVFIPHVVEGSPAAKAGVRPSDIVMKIAFEDALSLADVKSLLSSNAKRGKTLLITVKQPRGEEEKKFIKVPDDFNGE